MSISFGLLLMVLVCIGIYLIINNSELLSLSIAPFILSPILYLFSKKAIVIKVEIKSREI
ncbi:MAG: hypothetical protein JEZ01_11835 [Labilibaculum sp.]|nr:hypothetical protein [Labilibaculum sp.]MBI9058443.1 hypothetical protein [Labilibaculum sp.]